MRAAGGTSTPLIQLNVFGRQLGSVASSPASEAAHGVVPSEYWAKF
jgi:hypothetical protein